ncbi:hypothetical protein K469DRAFT_601797, partial [Zopfia rhizophila CBS 207.26]
DPNIVKIKNILYLVIKKILNLSSLKLTEGFFSYPEYNTKNTKIKLIVNYIKLLLLLNIILY